MCGSQFKNIKSECAYKQGAIVTEELPFDYSADYENASIRPGIIKGTMVLQFIALENSKLLKNGAYSTKVNYCHKFSVSYKE
jgi:hypothetical protein